MIGAEDIVDIEEKGEIAMRFGVCTDMSALPFAAKAGADYIECKVTELNGKTDEELAAFKDRLAEA
jgi:hypothetical protein